MRTLTRATRGPREAARGGTERVGWRSPALSRGGWGALAIVVVALPGMTRSSYHVLILGSVGIGVILSLSLSLLYGYAGQMSFAQGAFYGIGAYTAALMTTRAHVTFWVAVPCAMAVAGLVAYLSGRPTLRLNGNYLAIATLALQVAISQFFNQAGKITNGNVGIFGLVRPTGFTDDARYAELILAVAVLCVVASLHVANSRFGRALLAVRHDPEVAAAAGINPAHYKVAVFGALYAHQILFISPVTFDINQSVLVLSMVVIGGLASNAGAILGAIAVTLVTQMLFSFGDLSFLIYGVWIVLVIVLVPQGLIGIIRSAPGFLMALPRRLNKATHGPLDGTKAEGGRL